jgi:hypothetical protein
MEHLKTFIDYIDVNDNIRAMLHKHLGFKPIEEKLMEGYTNGTEGDYLKELSLLAFTTNTDINILDKIKDGKAWHWGVGDRTGMFNYSLNLYASIGYELLTINIVPSIHQLICNTLEERKIKEFDAEVLIGLLNEFEIKNNVTDKVPSFNIGQLRVKDRYDKDDLTISNRGCNRFGDIVAEKAGVEPEVYENSPLYVIIFEDPDGTVKALLEWDEIMNGEHES